LGKGREEVYNYTPHFYSLPQGERREKRKDFNKPLTLALSRRVEGTKGSHPSLLFSPTRGEKRGKERKGFLFYIGRGGGFYRGVGEDEECDRVIISLGS
jgi:hypothetical protein